jgi:hypothetical protein
VDETIDLTNNLDTGSATVSTVYNMELLANRTLQFTKNTTTSGRFVGGVITDSTIATAFVRAKWSGRSCEFQKLLNCSTTNLGTTLLPVSLSAFVPVTATQMTMFMYPSFSASGAKQVEIYTENNIHEDFLNPLAPFYLAGSSGYETITFPLMKKGETSTYYFRVDSGSSATNSINISSYQEHI